MRFEVGCILDDLGRVQQRLGRNASNVQAHPTKSFPTVDQHHGSPKIGRTERSRVPTRSSSDDQ
jgi:hypothetical protein